MYHIFIQSSVSGQITSMSFVIVVQSVTSDSLTP